MTTISIRAKAIPGRLVLGLLAGTALLAACTGGASPSASPAASPGASSGASAATSPSPAASPSAAASPSPAVSPTASTAVEPSPTVEATAVATSMDPCTIVTAGEVSALAGASLGPGEPSTTEGNARLCSYGQEGIAFEVIAAEAPDVATAKAEEAAAEALLQKAAANGLTVTELPGFAAGVDAAMLEGHLGSGTQRLDAIAIYVLKGKYYFGISDVATLGAAAPSADAMKAQALTTLGRIP